MQAEPKRKFEVISCNTDDTGPFLNDNKQTHIEDNVQNNFWFTNTDGEMLDFMSIKKQIVLTYPFFFFEVCHHLIM